MTQQQVYWNKIQIHGDQDRWLHCVCKIFLQNYWFCPLQSWLPLFFINTIFYFMWYYRNFSMTSEDGQDPIYSGSSEIGAEASCGFESIRNSVSGNLQVLTAKWSESQAVNNNCDQSLNMLKFDSDFQVDVWTVNWTFCFQATLALYGSTRLALFSWSRVNIPLTSLRSTLNQTPKSQR